MFFAFALFKFIDLHVEDWIIVVVAFHIADGVVNEYLLDSFGYLDFLLGKHRDHVGDEFSVEVVHEFEVSIFSLNEILHLEIFIFDKERIRRPYFVGDIEVLKMFLFILQAADNHVLHLQFDPINNSDNLLLDIPLSLLSSLFNYIKPKLLFLQHCNNF